MLFGVRRRRNLLSGDGSVFFHRSFMIAEYHTVHINSERKGSLGIKRRLPSTQELAPLIRIRSLNITALGQNHEQDGCQDVISNKLISRL